MRGRKSSAEQEEFETFVDSASMSSCTARRRKRDGASALLYLVQSVFLADTPRRLRPPQEEIIADAALLVIPLWPQLGDLGSGGPCEHVPLIDDARAIVAVDEHAEVRCEADEVATPERERKRVHIDSLMMSLPAESQQYILHRFKRLSIQAAR